MDSMDLLQKRRIQKVFGGKVKYCRLCDCENDTDGELCSYCEEHQGEIGFDPNENEDADKNWNLR